MSFIDKIKSGVSEAGQKAKVVVEVNKLKLVNVGKQNEINALYKKIGEKVYELSKQQEPIVNEQFAKEIEGINMLKIEISQNIQQIQNLSDEKLCPACGASNAITARECTFCHEAFPIHEVKAVEQQDLSIDSTEQASEKKDND